MYMQGSLYLSTTDILSAAEPVTKALNDITGEAVNMSIIDRAYSTIVLKEETKYRFRWGIHIGHSTLAYSSSMGKALLSELSDEEIDKLYPEENLKKITPKTVATKTELKRELEKIRKTGIAHIVEGDTPGISGVAAIIRDAGSKSVAAMSFSFPRFRVKKARRDILTKLIKLGASLVSYRLGYRDPNNQVHDVRDLYTWWEQNKSPATERQN
jgi:DNA-binding IclR family transcriptional regulator